MTLKNLLEFSLPCTVLFVLNLTTTTHALELVASIGSELTNNALKTHDNKITEQQDTLGVTALHSQESSRSQLDIDYSLNYRNYQKKSQESQLQVNGSSTAHFDITSNSDAWLSHSAKETLDSPGQPQLSSNTDNRHITVAGVNVYSSKGDYNTLTLSPSITDIHFRDNSDIDSTRKGIQLNWHRNATPITQLGITGLHQNINYAQGEDGKYDKANLNITRKLRQLSYHAEVGYNQINTSFGQRLSSPFVSFSVELDSGIHSITAKYNNSISDTSLGNQNDPLSNGIDGNRNSLDLFEQQQLYINHKHNQICRKCTTVITYNWLKENYQTEPLSDVREQGLSLVFKYNISPLNSLSWLARMESTDFFNRINEDYQQTNLIITYDITLGQSITVKLSTDYEFRESHMSSESYSEWSNNITLNLRL